MSDPVAIFEYLLHEAADAPLSYPRGASVPNPCAVVDPRSGEILEGPVASRGLNSPQSYMQHFADHCADVRRNAEPLGANVPLELYCIHFPRANRADFEKTMLPGKKPGCVRALFDTEFLLLGQGGEEEKDTHPSIRALRVRAAKQFAIPLFLGRHPDQSFGTIIQAKDNDGFAILGEGPEFRELLFQLVRSPAVIVSENVQPGLEAALIDMNKEDETEGYWRDSVPMLLPLESTKNDFGYDTDDEWEFFRGEHYVFLSVEAFRAYRELCPRARVVVREFIECRFVQRDGSSSAAVTDPDEICEDGVSLYAKDVTLLAQDQVVVTQYLVFGSPEERKRYVDNGLL